MRVYTLSDMLSEKKLRVYTASEAKGLKAYHCTDFEAHLGPETRDFFFEGGGGHIDQPIAPLSLHSDTYMVVVSYYDVSRGVWFIRWVDATESFLTPGTRQDERILWYWSMHRGCPPM